MDGGKGEMCSGVKEDDGQTASPALFSFVIVKTGLTTAGYFYNKSIHFNHSAARGLVTSIRKG